MRNLEILVLCLVLTSGTQGQHFREELGLLLPHDRVTVPEQLSVNTYGFSFPDPTKPLRKLDVNLLLLEDVLSNGQIFKRKHDSNFSPLHDMAKTMHNIVVYITKEIKLLDEASKKPAFGHYLDTAEIIKFEFENLIPSLTFQEAEYYIKELNSSRSEIPEAGDHLFRNGPKFQRLLFVTSFLSKQLHIFERNFKAYVDTILNLQRGNVNAIQNDFLDNLLKDHFQKSYTLVEVPAYLKNNQHTHFCVEIALYDTMVELYRLKPVQYFNFKLEGEFYGDEDSNSIYAKECLTDHLCYPKISRCTTAIENHTLFEVTKECPLRQSNAEYDVVEERGLIIYQEPRSNNLIALLAELGMKIDTYPTLVTYFGCFIDDATFLEICFKETKKSIRSKYNNDTLYKILHPVYYNRFLRYLMDFPFLFAVILITISLFCTLLCCQCVRKRVRKYRKERRQEKYERVPKNERKQKVRRGRNGRNP